VTVLTRLIVDPAHSDARRDDRDLHATHRRLETLAHGWPDSPRLLWQRPSPGVLLVQGARPLPDAALPYAQLADHTDVGVLLGGLARGQQVTVRTVVNPTWKPVDRPRRRYPEHERPRWLAGLLAPALTVHQVTGRFLGFREGRKPGVAAPVVLAWWSAVVTATVADPTLFARQVRDGVGRGRAFGCGLLDVTPDAVPDLPVADAYCPACAAALPVAPLPGECARCHVGVGDDGQLGGFTEAAVAWWRDRAFSACVSKCGFRSETAARNVMEKTARERPRHANAGTPTVWECLCCGRWHWGNRQPGDPVVLPAVVPALRPLVLRERAQRWNQAQSGPNGGPRSLRDQRKAAR
jgi:CRISPR system Cascade subunit CasE